MPRSRKAFWGAQGCGCGFARGLQIASAFQERATAAYSVHLLSCAVDARAPQRDLCAVLGGPGRDWKCCEASLSFVRSFDGLARLQMDDAGNIHNSHACRLYVENPMPYA